MTPPSPARRLVIAIDGPAGAGKSTCARRLAARLGYRFLDTGAIYRAVALAALRQGIDASDAARIEAVARRVTIVLEQPPEGSGAAGRVTLDGEDVSAAIRGAAVNTIVPAIAAHPGVRDAVIPFQRRFAKDGGVVAEGRDIGTVVFPNADVKFFIDADERVRAERRALERGDKDVAAVVREIHARDVQDKGRKVAPLKPAADAVRVDTTHLTIDQVVEALAEEIQRRNPASPT